MADKALLLGINKYKSVNGLRGCVNDVNRMKDLLAKSFEFLPANVKVLVDDKVVKAEVIRQMKWLFKDAQPGDRVVFHFSGHGSQTADLDGDEDDGWDEMLCLYDMDFHDPESYLLDDELHRWTDTLPQGVQLTVVLDSCHSGTGTRMLLAPLADKPGQHMPMLVDVRVASNRVLNQNRGLSAADVAHEITDPGSDKTVRIRYLEPPADIKAAVTSRLSKKRDLVEVKLNHLLLSACRADQTAADATINNTPSGAFTYYLCDTILKVGPYLERKDLISRVERALDDARFNQAPQLEGTGTGPIFLPRKAVGAAQPSVDKPLQPEIDPTDTSCPYGTLDQVTKAIDSVGRLAPEAQPDAIQLLLGFAQGRTAQGLTGRGAAGHYLVYVHGICKHVAGYSDDWWGALHPFTSVFSAGTLGDTRREVLWSDLVNERGLKMKSDAGRDSRATEQRRLKDEIEETLRDRVDRSIVEAAPRTGPGAGARSVEELRGLISIPGLNCLDDFTVYMVDESVRTQVIARFTNAVKPLLDSGSTIDIISHSWGTVVAYEGLRQLTDEGHTQPLVHCFFTVGAALSIGPVKMRLRPANQDGKRPALVQRWVNVNARGDLVGGPLQGRPYQVDNDFPNVEPFGCGSLLGVVSPSCAHGSYFVAGNDAVNRDIFGIFINSA